MSTFKRKKQNSLLVSKHLTFHSKLILGCLLALLFFNLSCRKAESLLPNYPIENNPIHNKFFDLNKVSDPEVFRLAANLKKLDSSYNFIDKFSKKNGFPRWDMVDYKISKSNANFIYLNNTNQSEDTSASGLFFLPFQNPESNQISGYLAVRKHGGNVYSYQMYNRDSLASVMPSKGAACKEITSLMAIIGHFERKINGKKSIDFPKDEYVQIATSKLGFKESGGSNNIGFSLNNSYCFAIIEVCVEYEITYNTSYTEVVIETVGFYDSFIVEIPCDNGSGGADGNNNNGDNNSPGWSNNGTGQNTNGNGEGESGGGGGNNNNGGPNTEDEYDPWWNEGGGGDFRIINNKVVTPSLYPGMDIGFAWLWWENVIITPEDRTLFDKIYEEDPFQLPETGEPCKGTNRLGSILQAGNVEHWMIQVYYLSKNLMAKREYQIPNAGPNGGPGYADLVNLSTSEIFEIKPANNQIELERGRQQLNRYIPFALSKCNLVLVKGYNFNSIILQYSGKPNSNMRVSLPENGIITYEEVSKVQFPQSVIVTTTVIERLKKLMKELKDYPALSEKTLKEFFDKEENAEILTAIQVGAFTLGAATLAATIVEDFYTLGGGTWNDAASFAFAWRLINFALK